MPTFIKIVAFENVSPINKKNDILIICPILYNFCFQEGNHMNLDGNNSYEQSTFSFFYNILISFRKILLILVQLERYRLLLTRSQQH